MNTPRTETPYEGFTVEYRADGIIVYRITDIRRQATDYWVELFKTHVAEAMAEQRHLRRIMDLRSASFPTPYAMAKVAEVISNDPEDLRESYAILVGDSMPNQVLKASLGRFRKWITNTRVFTDEQSAIEWLQQRLDELGE